MAPSRSDIELEVRLFNRALALAWAQVTPEMKARKTDINETLATLIRNEINSGKAEPVEIAAEALKRLGQK